MCILVMANTNQWVLWQALGFDGGLVKQTLMSVVYSGCGFEYSAMTSPTGSHRSATSAAFNVWLRLTSRKQKPKHFILTQINHLSKW